MESCVYYQDNIDGDSIRVLILVVMESCVYNLLINRL